MAVLALWRGGIHGRRCARAWGDIAVGEGAVWVTALRFPISRIDPLTSKVVQQFTAEGGDAIRVGLGSVWLPHLKAGKLWLLDPRRIEATRPE